MKRKHIICSSALILFLMILCFAMLVSCKVIPDDIESDTPKVNESTPEGSETESSGSESENSVHTHIGEVVPGKEATCAATGLTDGKKCSVCGEIIIEQKEIPLKDHTYEDGFCRICGKKEPMPSEGLEFTLNPDDQSYTVSGIGACKDVYVVIPSAYNGKPVTSIGVRAFYECISLTGVTIPDSVTSIEYGAFLSCAALTSITIPDSVTSIGDGAFYFCCGLTSVTIGNSVESIGTSAFSECNSLTSITIPDSVKSIGDDAFNACNDLMSITIGNSLTSIGERVFSGCSLEEIEVGKGNKVYHSAGNCIIETESKKLTVGCGNSVIPTDGSVTSIGDYAFSGCSSLTNITIPDSVTSIGFCAFSGCRSLTNITIPDSVTCIKRDAFQYCSSLTSITIPDSIKSIGVWVFSECNILKYNEYDNAYYLGNQTNPYLILVKAKDSEITSCNINTNTKVICSGAFSMCRNLTSITIPNSVINIGVWAFDECSSLTNITFNGTVEQWNKISKDNAWDYNAGDYKVYCTDGIISK